MMRVYLVSHTPYPDSVCAEAAAVCYRASNPDAALDGAMRCGHESVLEHASFTFRLEGVSRALLAQLTRHRIASFSVESQRYVSMADSFDYVIPLGVYALGTGAVERYRVQMDIIHDWYREWQERLMGAGATPEGANEDARFVLPNAAATTITVTMNARELRHFFALRCCNRAQWEIREAANIMLLRCKEVAPKLFENAGPGCMRGPCPEGKRSCGRPKREEDKR